jgi:hypothetical protein
MELMKPLLHLEMFSTPNRLLDDLIKESIEARLSSLEKLLKEAQLPVIRITCYKYNRLEANCLIALSQILDLFLYTHIRKVLERKAKVISLPPSTSDIQEMFVRLRYIHFPPSYENSVQETLYQPREGNVFIHKRNSIVNTTLLTLSYVEEELQRITSNFDK